MRILLLSPPLFEPREPYLALPSLKAFLEQNGYAVTQRDINAEFFNIVLTSGYLNQRYSDICSKFNELSNKKFLNKNQKRLYTLLKDTINSAPHIIKKIDKARQLLTGKDSNLNFSNSITLNIKILWNLMILRSGFRIINLSHYPTVFNFSTLKMKFSLASSSAILNAINDRKENIFLSLFEHYFLPGILSEEPGLVGISINDYQQVIPGLTLAKLIKDKGIYVTIGGAAFTTELKINEVLFQACDSFIINEGEHALLELIKQLEGARNFYRVPNLAWFDTENNKIFFNRLNYSEDLDSLPTPDFVGMPSNQYFNFLIDKTRFPIIVSKGCYWNRCAFCDIPREKYKARKTSLIIKDIIRIINNYKITSFFFVGESLAPEILQELSNEIIKLNLKIKWEGLTRLESEFTEDFCRLLAKSGCKKLFIGIESGSQRILNFMNKGTQVKTNQVYLNNLKKAGIATHVFMLVGFPTETKKEAQESLDFLLQNRKKLDVPGFTLGINTVNYCRTSKLFQEPEKYKIEGIRTRNRDDDLESRDKYVYTPSDSLAFEEAEKLVPYWHNVIYNKFYYLGLRNIILKEDRTRNIFARVTLLSFKLLKHWINYEIGNLIDNLNCYLRSKQLYENRKKI